MKSILKILVTLITVSTLLSTTTFGSTHSDSLYDAATMHWKDELKNDVTLAQWKGLPVVITMAYTSCTHTCPMIIKKLKQIQSGAEKLGIAPEFVIVTFDPTVDTSETLAKYKKASGIDSTHWHFLTGTDKSVRKLSAILGVNYRKNQKTGEIMHGNKIFLLDANGKISITLDGLNAGPEPLIAQLKQNHPPNSSQR